jgi:hypothetical protein
MARDPHRYRLTRAGVLNVWQYDEQVFTFADGRLLLRGTNGAGKSKTLEMLLPFVLDGDKARMTATGRQGSQLLWLMSDGASGTGTRIGYLWVELARVDASGETQVVTCGIGLRSSASARQVTTWQFTVPGAVPDLCEPDGTPLSAPRCKELVESLGGSVFEAPRAYKEHVGRLLFGLEPQAYDDLLRLLYWLRQPQVGEDIDPARLVAMLDEALPALDDEAVRQVGEAFDELAEHGERVRSWLPLPPRSRRRRRSTGATPPPSYGSGRLPRWPPRRARRPGARGGSGVGGARAGRRKAAGRETEQRAAGERLAQASSRVQVLESGPLARNQQVLREKQRRASDLSDAAVRAREAAERATARRRTVGRGSSAVRPSWPSRAGGWWRRPSEIDAGLRTCGLAGALPAGDDAVGSARRLSTRYPRPGTASPPCAPRCRSSARRSVRVEKSAQRRDAAAERAARQSDVRSRRPARSLTQRAR